MEKVLKLYTYVDGANDTPFPNEEEQVLVGDFRSDYKRMGNAPTITCTVLHRLCLDNLWSYNVYASFNGEKFFIKQIPTSSYDNTDARYKHELELVGERVILDNVYFYDVVADEYEEDRPVSNSSNFVFFGDIHEFAARLNHSLNYSGVGYSVVVDDGVTSEGKLMSFQDQFFSSVLQEIYNTYEIPYYIVGKVIHIGYAENEIEHVFKYGVNESLLSIQKQNANHKIVNRITGVGSADNIPYYYPNVESKGETELLYNGEVGLVDIVDESKYKKLRLSDKFVYIQNKEDDEIYTHQLIEYDEIIIKPVDFPNYIWELSCDLLFNVKRTGNILFSLTTTTTGTNFVYGELYNEHWESLGIVRDGDIMNNIAKGDYRIRITWNIKARPAIAPVEALFLVREHLKVSLTRLGAVEYSWALNHLKTSLAEHGLISNTYAKVGDTITIRQISYIKPSTNLMPSIYRSSLAKERFYNAENEAYINPETNEYYSFNNPFIVGKPKEHIENFDDIKPTIKEMTNAYGLRIDIFSEFAYDLNDNDETDDEGNYLHPYFFGKLRKFDGEYGFNLFDHAIDESEMVISMTSGNCGACEWIIGVDEDAQKNPVQVDENGNLKRDENGNVIRSGSFQDRQNDTQNYEVWIALKKDINTFGVIMPNAANNYRPSVEDTFVILHIDLPQAYILAAEKRLEQSLIKYMSENNDEKFTFSLSFSRIFFAENPNILAQLNENSRIQIEYDGMQYQLYVSSYSYNMASNTPLPEIKIELSDVLTIAQNSLQNTISDLKSDVLSSINVTEAQLISYTSTTKKELDSRIDGTKQELNQSISVVETNVKEYASNANAFLYEALKTNVNENYVTQNTEQEVTGKKDFIGGLNVNGQEIVYDKENGYWLLNGNLVITGGVTMYADDGSVDIPSIAEGLPFDGETIWFNNETKQIEVIGGVGDGDKTFYFEQQTASDTWEIVHNMGKRPSIMTFDSANNEVHGDIIYDNDNKITISFSYPFTGKVILN